MAIITIESKNGSLLLHDGKLPKSTLEWRGDGVECYKKGSFPTQQYHAACNLLNNWALDRHIPLVSIRRQK